MRKLLLVITLFSLNKQCRAQDHQKSLLHFQSYAYNLNVTTGENLIITTKAGEVAVSNSIKDLWKKVNPVENVENSFGVTLEQGNFFNKDTGFVSGFINNNGTYNIIYHTSDAGKHWKAMKFSQKGWIDNASNLDNGEAWMSVAGSGIAYTEDYGYSWKALDIPERKQRFTSIWFNNKREGVIGSLWNMIAVTMNNCETWKIIPTPLDQKKYAKTNTKSRPEINKVAFFNNKILCSQEGMIFYTNKDSINWVWLPDYVDFYTDNQNSALYFKNKQDRFVKSGNGLTKIATSEIISGITTARCMNGKLFIFCGDRMIEFKIDNSLATYFTYTKEIVSINPEVFAFNQLGIYGNIENKIYRQSSYEGQWKYLFTLPFNLAAGKLSMVGIDQIVFSNNSDSVFYYDIAKKNLVIKNRKNVIANFCASEIKKIIFSEGSSGCFHHYSDDLIYTKENGEFKSDKINSTGTVHPQELTANDEFIDERAINDFVKGLPDIIHKHAEISDIGFTESDYNRCKKDIIEFRESGRENKRHKASKFDFPRNNLDFDRLISLTDSVKEMDSIKLNYVLFNLSDIVSTTTSWVKIRLINKNNEELDISHYYYKPNAFYLPWIISINGSTFVSTNVAINHFLENVYPSFLQTGNKLEVLYDLVKSLY